ncbi:MFS transporter [Maritalea sp.]|uniref:MFS transporter n=1 Tax=Maritalea sp. TaxID=2003361 RepID=UPI003EF7CC9A
MKLPNDKNLRRILRAQLPADFADWLDYVAIISLFTYTWTVDPIYFAFFALAFALPYLVIGPFAGALVDKSSLKTIMVWSNLGRAITTLALAFAGQPEIVLVLVFLRASIDSFFSPAKQAAIQALSEKRELMATNSLSQIINQTSKIAGPAVGGALLLIVSSQAVFLINGMVSVVALMILLTLPKNLRPTEEPRNDGDAKDKKSESIFAEIAQGYATVAKIPALWVTIGLGSFGYFAIFLHDTLLGPVTRELGYDQTVFGLSISMVGAGGVLGAWALGSIKRQFHPYMMIGPGMIMAAGFTLLLGFATYFMWALPLWIFVPAFFVVGFFSSAIFVPLRTVLQLETLPDKMGRVTAVNEAMNVIAMLGAPFVGALMASQFGLSIPFMVGGGLSLTLGVVALFLIRVIKFKKVDQETAPPDEHNSA